MSIVRATTHRLCLPVLLLALVVTLLAFVPAPAASAETLSAGTVQTIDLQAEWQAQGLDSSLLEPEFVTMLPGGNAALVTIQEGSAVAAVYNAGGTWRLSGIFPLAARAEPDGIAVTGDGKLAATANEGNQTVSLLNLSGRDNALTVVSTVYVPDLLKDEPNLKTVRGKVDPEGITILNRNGKNYALVALEKSACLLVLDITDPHNVQKVTTLPVGSSGDEANSDDRVAEPEGVAVSPDGSLIAVGNEKEGTVSLIPVRDGEKGVAFGQRVNYDPAGSECEIVSFTPDSKKLLVTNSKEKQVFILDISDVSKVSTIKSVSMAVYGEPTSVAVHPGGEYALVTVVDGGNPTINPGKVLAISLLDGSLGRILQEFAVGQVPDSIAISKDGKSAVVANEGENSDNIAGNISVLDLTGITPPAGGAFSGIKVAVFADPHYFDPALLEKPGKAFYDYLVKDRKLIAESSAIARAAVDAIKASDAELVLVPGDLTKDGEKSGHQQFAGLLAELEAAGKKVYVINGNHDVNNTNAVKYLGDTAKRVDTVSPAEFKDIYREFGYGEAIATDPNSLSYVAEPVPGLRLIVMDSCDYQPKATVEGAFSPETLSWVKQQVAAAARDGKLVIGMMHHGLIDHFSVQRQFFPEYIVQDADQVAKELAACGLQVVFTGHFHAQDVVQRQFGNKTLYDIETGSLVTYPSPYRLVEITPDQKLKITTHNIQSINYDTNGKDFTTYARDYLQQGLNGLVPQIVAGILIKQGIPRDQALQQADKKLAAPVAPGLTVKDLLVNAMVGHYHGDETIDPRLMSAIKTMAAADDSLTKMIGQALLSLGTDPAPADNDVTIDLAASAPGDQGSQWELTIMHTNDTHAHLEDDKALVARRAAAVKQIRSEAPNSLLLDAGDVFSGTLYFTQYQGQADLEFMNMLGYDAMGLGNHEFDKGPQGLAAFITGKYTSGYKETARFPLVNANIDFSGEPALSGLAKNTLGEEKAGTSLGGAIYPAVILDVNGEKVGLFGVTTEDTKEISSPGTNVKINNALQAANSAVKTLSDKGINKIIAISHLGWDEDMKLAEQVEGIDVVVGGHSHTTPEQYPALVTDSQYRTPTLVVQAGEYGKYLGRLNVDFNNAGLVTNCSGGLLDITAKDAAGGYTYAVDQAVYDRLISYKAPLEELKNTMVGSTQVALDGDRNNVRTKETNLGNLIADAMLAKGAQAGAVMAITNGGGVRASIDQGDITLGEVLTVMPFGNTLVVLELTGQQITDALENGVGEVEKKAGKFPQVAGMKFTWDPQKPAGSRIAKVEVKTASGYQPIDRNTKYLVATNNFMAGGGDGYTAFKAASRVIDMGFVDYEVFKEYLQKHSPVNPQVEGRITEGKASTTPGGGGGGSSGGSSSGGGSSSSSTSTPAPADNNPGQPQPQPVPQPQTQPAPVVTFGDTTGHWAQKDIALMAEKGVVHGVASGKFAPNAPVSRAEFAAMLVNALGITESGDVPFSDVPGNTWFYQSVAKAYAAGLVSGVTKNAFAPQTRITRQEMAAMLVRALAQQGQPAKVSAKETGQILSRFNDRQEIAPWAANALAAAVKEGLISGRGKDLAAPKASATRAESVVMIKRLLQKAGKL